MMESVKSSKLRVNQRQCWRCSWRWIIRIKDPKCCPHCKSYEWHLKPIDKELSCKKCEWTWKPKKENPLSCPHCRSYNWK